MICFLSVKERVEPDPNQVSSAKQDLLDTFRNRPWVILFCATLMIFIMLVVRGGSLTFYMQNYVDGDAMSAFLAKMGLMKSEGVAPAGFRAVAIYCPIL